jgi:dihydroorotate dehydrogenase (NAD+) catalytic subunit
LSVESLKTSVGGVPLANPVLLASGVQGSSIDRVLEALRLGAGGAVTKSIGPRPRQGYAEPTLAKVEAGWVNAVGLSNPGADAFALELGKIKGRSLPVIASIFGANAPEFGEVAVKLQDGDLAAFELNLSCPHVEGVGTEVGHDPELVAEVVTEVKRKTKKPVIVKLSPNTERLLEVAGAAVDSGADGLTAVNTLRAMSIDAESGRPVLSNKIGGLSGAGLRPVALRCVYELKARYDVPIMGCGGVSTWEHAIQFILAGAEAVQVGAATLEKFAVFNDINLGILSYLEKKGKKNISEIVGTAHV